MLPISVRRNMCFEGSELHWALLLGPVRLHQRQRDLCRAVLTAVVDELFWFWMYS